MSKRYNPHGLAARYRERMPPYTAPGSAACMPALSNLMDCFMAHEFDRDFCMPEVMKLKSCMVLAQAQLKHVSSMNHHMRRLLRRKL